MYWFDGSIVCLSMDLSGFPRSFHQRFQCKHEVHGVSSLRNHGMQPKYKTGMSYSPSWRREYQMYVSDLDQSDKRKQILWTFGMKVKLLVSGKIGVSDVWGSGLWTADILKWLNAVLNCLCLIWTSTSNIYGPICMSKGAIDVRPTYWYVDVHIAIGGSDSIVSCCTCIATSFQKLGCLRYSIKDKHDCFLFIKVLSPWGWCH
jgi:hypothetical protein